MLRAGFRAAAGLLGITLTLAACGTRVDRAAFYDQLRRQAALTGDAGTAGSTVSGPATGGGTTTPGSGGGRSPAVLGTRTSAPTGGGGAAGGADPIAAVPANVSRAIVGDTITIGMHVPSTGAAPLPLNWTDTLDVVQRYINAEARVHGRTVRFVVEDDGYDPAKGLAACRKLADENVLFVIGHTMPTVQDSCAGFFNSRGIPYLIRGVPEATLKGRPITYFGTASDDVQAGLLADYVLARLGGKTKNVAVVTENDQPTSKTVFVNRITAGGGTVVAVENSVPRQPDFAPIISKLQQADAGIVFLNIAPVDAIKIAVQSQGAGYHPTWVGEGTHWNYNLTLESAGAAMDGAISLSPWASIDSAAASGYREVFKTYNPKGTPDDVGLVIWGWTMLVRQALLDAGPSLSRASFAQALNSLDFNVPYWHRVRYTPTDHTGATSVAVFKADGQAKRWRQIEGFTSRF